MQCQPSGNCVFTAPGARNGRKPFRDTIQLGDSRWKETNLIKKLKKKSCTIEQILLFLEKLCVMQIFLCLTLDLVQKKNNSCNFVWKFIADYTN